MIRRPKQQLEKHAEETPVSCGHGGIRLRRKSTGAGTRWGVPALSLIHIYKHVWLSGLSCKGICLGGLSAAKLYGAALQQIAPADFLADAQQYPVGIHGDGVGVVVSRVKAVIVIKYGDTPAESDGFDAAVFYHQFFWAPAVVDGDALCFRLLDLLVQGCLLYTSRCV